MIKTITKPPKDCTHSGQADFDPVLGWLCKDCATPLKNLSTNQLKDVEAILKLFNEGR